MGTEYTILDDINPYSSDDAEGWSERPTGQRTLARVVDQISDDVLVFDQRLERRRRPWLTAVAVAVVVAVAIPAVILGSFSRGDTPGSGDAAGDGAVRLGVGHVWPAESRQLSPEALASAFAAELLGWVHVTTTVESGSDPSGPVWVTLQQPGSPELKVLTAPLPEGGRVLFQVGDPLSIRAVEPGQPRGWRIELEQPTDAVSADLTIRTLDTTVVLNAGTAELRRGYIETLKDVDPRRIEAMLVRYRNSDGGVVAAAGGSFGAEPEPTELTVDETQQIQVWVNQLSLNQLDPAVWRNRFDRMCGEGVWNPDVALALSGEFIDTDLNAGASVRSENIGPPLAEDGAVALWLMAVNTCRDRFPQGAIEQGPPTFGTGG